MKRFTDGNGNPGVEPKSKSRPQDHVALTVEDHPKKTVLPADQPKKTVVPAAVPNSEGFAELEIRSLLWMEQVGNEVYAKAHRTWTKKDSLFANRIDMKKNQSSSLRNEIYQLIGFYSVFQGVLLTAVAQSNLLHCNNWWSAFFLSLLASMVTVGGVWQKFKAILALEKTIHNEAFTRQQCIKQASLLLKKRGSFDFNVDAKDGKEHQFPETKLQLYIALVVLILVVFSGLFLASIYRIVCHPYTAAAPAANTA